MDCRHTILFSNKLIYCKINTKGDYNYKSQITFNEWFQLRRYEIGFFRAGEGGYKWYINKSDSIW